MARYYSGAHPVTSASEGLMAGFEFVDRIQQRRRQLELEERAQGRADRHLEITEDANRRASEAHDLSIEAGRYTLDRTQAEDTREDTLFAQQQGEFQRSRRVRGENEAARSILAGDLLQRGPMSLSTVGTEGLTLRSPTQSERAPTAMPTAQPVPIEPEQSNPIDLRAAQRDVDNAPGFGERMSNVLVNQREQHKTYQADRFWAEVANPKSTVGTSYNSSMGHSVALRDVRLNPTKYADQYLSDRSRVSPTSRATLDLTMGNALKERQAEITDQIQSLDPTDQRNATRIRSLTSNLIDVNQRLDTLAKAATSTTAADAGITRAAKVDDPRIVPAITAAADKARQTQPILETTPDELRAARAVVTRAGTAKRLNEKQIAALTTLYAHGEIDADQLNNWSKYGAPIAPKPPTIQALGEGYAAVVTEQGISLMRLPDEKGENTQSRSNRRLLVNDRLKQIQDGLTGMVEAGELSEGSAIQHFTRFLQILKREGPQLQTKTGAPLIAEDGALSIAEADPGEIAELLSSYAAYDAGEVQPWVFKGNKSFTEYAPQGVSPGEEIIDLTAAFRQ